MVAVSLLGRLATDTATLRAHMNLLTRQVSDGRKGNLYGDIAPAAKQAIDLRAEIAMRGTYQGTIDGALARTQVTQTVLGQLQSIANDAQGWTLSLPGTDARRVTMVAQQARSALEQVAQLLNTQQAGQYVFGGSDFGNPPIPDPKNIMTSGMVTQIGAAVTGLVPGGAAAVAAASLAAAGSDTAGVTPFSAYLSNPATGLVEPRRSVPDEDGSRMDYGIVANRNAAATSTGNTTGSWARDLMRGLATLAAIDPSQVALGSDFQTVIADARTAITSSSEALSQEQGLLGSVEKRLDIVKQSHADLTVSLKTQISAIEEVDPAETIARLQATQTQLQISYQAISTLSSLTLAKYLA